MHTLTGNDAPTLILSVRQHHPAGAPARDWLVLAAATASGSAKIIVKIRGPANGDRATGGRA